MMEDFFCRHLTRRWQNSQTCCHCQSALHIASCAARRCRCSRYHCTPYYPRTYVFVCCLAACLAPFCLACWVDGQLCQVSCRPRCTYIQYTRGGCVAEGCSSPGAPGKPAAGISSAAADRCGRPVWRVHVLDTSADLCTPYVCTCLLRFGTYFVPSIAYLPTTCEVRPSPKSQPNLGAAHPGLFVPRAPTASGNLAETDRRSAAQGDGEGGEGKGEEKGGGLWALGFMRARHCRCPIGTGVASHSLCSGPFIPITWYYRQVYAAYVLRTGKGKAVPAH